MMDLNQLDIVAFSNAGITVPVLHPITNEPLVGEQGPFTMKVLGRDSTAYRQANSLAIQRRFAIADDAEKVNPEGINQERLTVLSACLVEMNGFVMNGQPLPYSVENASLVVHTYPWLADQIEKTVMDRDKFFLSNSKS